ncbi:hypothetical protein D9M71_340420 [compost metagenome]
MVGDEARVDAVALDDVEVQRLQQAFGGGTQGEVGFDVDHVPLHVAAFHHGLELAVVGGAVLHYTNAAGLAEGLGPGLLLRILGGAAPTDETETVGGDGGSTGRGEECCGEYRDCTFFEHHLACPHCCVCTQAGLVSCPLIRSSDPGGWGFKGGRGGRRVPEIISAYGMAYYGMPKILQVLGVPIIAGRGVIGDEWWKNLQENLRADRTVGWITLHRSTMAAHAAPQRWMESAIHPATWGEPRRMG